MTICFFKGVNMDIMEHLENLYVDCSILTEETMNKIDKSKFLLTRSRNEKKPFLIIRLTDTMTEDDWNKLKKISLPFQTILKSVVKL